MTKPVELAGSQPPPPREPVAPAGTAVPAVAPQAQAEPTPPPAVGDSRATRRLAGHEAPPVTTVFDTTTQITVGLANGMTRALELLNRTAELNDPPILTGNVMAGLRTLAGGGRGPQSLDAAIASMAPVMDALAPLAAGGEHDPLVAARYRALQAAIETYRSQPDSLDRQAEVLEAMDALLGEIAAQGIQDPAVLANLDQLAAAAAASGQVDRLLASSGSSDLGMLQERYNLPRTGTFDGRTWLAAQLTPLAGGLARLDNRAVLGEHVLQREVRTARTSAAFVECGSHGNLAARLRADPDLDRRQVQKCLGAQYEVTDDGHVRHRESGRVLSDSDVDTLASRRVGVAEEELGRQRTALSALEVQHVGHLAPDRQQSYLRLKDGIDSVGRGRVPSRRSARIVTPFALGGAAGVGGIASRRGGPIQVQVAGRDGGPARTVTMPPISQAEHRDLLTRMRQGPVDPASLSADQRAMMAYWEQTGDVHRNEQGQYVSDLTDADWAEIDADLDLLTNPQTDAERALVEGLMQLASAVLDYRMAVDVLAASEQEDTADHEDQSDDGTSPGTPDVPAPTVAPTAQTPAAAPEAAPDAGSGPTLAPRLPMVRADRDDAARHRDRRTAELRDEDRQRAEAYAASVQARGRELHLERREARQVTDVQVIDGVAVAVNGDGQQLGIAPAAPSAGTTLS